jgi:GNAT superfamily N-acetyltransferase
VTRKSDISIRKFTQSDLGAVRKLIFDTIDVCYRDDYCQEAIKFFKDWHCDEHILKDARAGYMIVLVEDGKIVGTGTINDGEIKRVFVEPAMQRKGFGKLIMQKLEEQANLEGLDVVRLDASLPSEKFYDLLGYVTIKKTFRNVENGKKLDYYIMEKSLRK